eukprot:GHVN01034718.1.p1 GENE.GHVN01034718.1~~GHVN01034718.1.p1  ORF type:complete len:2915 (+),score=260.17 GHVN01034718.1:3-8747(+)
MPRSSKALSREHQDDIPSVEAFCETPSSAISQLQRVISLNGASGGDEDWVSQNEKPLQATLYRVLRGCTGMPEEKKCDAIMSANFLFRILYNFKTFGWWSGTAHWEHCWYSLVGSMRSTSKHMESAVRLGALLVHHLIHCVGRMNTCDRPSLQQIESCSHHDLLVLMTTCLGRLSATSQQLLPNDFPRIISYMAITIRHLISSVSEAQDGPSLQVIALSAQLGYAKVYVLAESFSSDFTPFHQSYLMPILDGWKTFNKADSETLKQWSGTVETAIESAFFNYVATRLDGEGGSELGLMVATFPFVKKFIEALGRKRSTSRMLAFCARWWTFALSLNLPQRRGKSADTKNPHGFVIEDESLDLFGGMLQLTDSSLRLLEPAEASAKKQMMEVARCSGQFTKDLLSCTEMCSLSGSSAFAIIRICTYANEITRRAVLRDEWIDLTLVVFLMDEAVKRVQYIMRETSGLPGSSGDSLAGILFQTAKSAATTSQTLFWLSSKFKTYQSRSHPLSGMQMSAVQNSVTLREASRAAHEACLTCLQAKLQLTSCEETRFISLHLQAASFRIGTLCNVMFLGVEAYVGKCSPKVWWIDETQHTLNCVLREETLPMIVARFNSLRAVEDLDLIECILHCCDTIRCASHHLRNSNLCELSEAAATTALSWLQDLLRLDWEPIEVEVTPADTSLVAPPGTPDRSAAKKTQSDSGDSDDPLTPSHGLPNGSRMGNLTPNRAPFRLIKMKIKEEVELEASARPYANPDGLTPDHSSWRMDPSSPATPVTRRVPSSNRTPARYRTPRRALHSARGKNVDISQLMNEQASPLHVELYLLTLEQLLHSYLGASDYSTAINMVASNFVRLFSQVDTTVVQFLRRSILQLSASMSKELLNVHTNTHSEALSASVCSVVRSVTERYARGKILALESETIGRDEERLVALITSPELGTDKWLDVAVESIETVSSHTPNRLKAPRRQRGTPKRKVIESSSDEEIAAPHTHQVKYESVQIKLARVLLVLEWRYLELCYHSSYRRGGPYSQVYQSHHSVVWHAFEKMHDKIESLCNLFSTEGGGLEGEFQILRMKSLLGRSQTGFWAATAATLSKAPFIKHDRENNEDMGELVWPVKHISHDSAATRPSNSCCNSAVEILNNEVTMGVGSTNKQPPHDRLHSEALAAFGIASALNSSAPLSEATMASLRSVCGSKPPMPQKKATAKMSYSWIPSHTEQRYEVEAGWWYSAVERESLSHTFLAISHQRLVASLKEAGSVRVNSPGSNRGDINWPANPESILRNVHWGSCSCDALGGTAPCTSTLCDGRASPLLRRLSESCDLSLSGILDETEGSSQAQQANLVQPLLVAVSLLKPFWGWAWQPNLATPEQTTHQPSVNSGCTTHSSTGLPWTMSCNSSCLECIGLLGMTTCILYRLASAAGTSPDVGGTESGHQWVAIADRCWEKWASATKGYFMLSDSSHNLDVKLLAQDSPQSKGGPRGIDTAATARRLRRHHSETMTLRLEAHTHLGLVLSAGSLADYVDHIIGEQTAGGGSKQRFYSHFRFRTATLMSLFTSFSRAYLCCGVPEHAMYLAHESFTEAFHASRDPTFFGQPELFRLEPAASDKSVVSPDCTAQSLYTRWQDGAELFSYATRSIWQQIRVTVAAMHLFAANCMVMGSPQYAEFPLRVGLQIGQGLSSNVSLVTPLICTYLKLMLAKGADPPSSTNLIDTRGRRSIARMEESEAFILIDSDKDEDVSVGDDGSDEDDEDADDSGEGEDTDYDEDPSDDEDDVDERGRADDDSTAELHEEESSLSRIARTRRSRFGRHSTIKAQEEREETSSVSFKETRQLSEKRTHQLYHMRECLVIVLSTKKTAPVVQIATVLDALAVFDCCVSFDDPNIIGVRGLSFEREQNRCTSNVVTTELLRRIAVVTQTLTSFSQTRTTPSTKVKMSVKPLFFARWTACRDALVVSAAHLRFSNDSTALCSKPNTQKWLMDAFSAVHGQMGRCGTGHPHHPVLWKTAVQLMDKALTTCNQHEIMNTFAAPMVRDRTTASESSCIICTAHEFLGTINSFVRFSSTSNCNAFLIKCDELIAKLRLWTESHTATEPCRLQFILQLRRLVFASLSFVSAACGCCQGELRWAAASVAVGVLEVGNALKNTLSLVSGSCQPSQQTSVCGSRLLMGRTSKRILSIECAPHCSRQSTRKTATSKERASERPESGARHRSAGASSIKGTTTVSSSEGGRGRSSEPCAQHTRFTFWQVYKHQQRIVQAVQGAQVGPSFTLWTQVRKMQRSAHQRSCEPEPSTHAIFEVLREETGNLPPINKAEIDELQFKLDGLEINDNMEDDALHEKNRSLTKCFSLDRHFGDAPVSWSFGVVTSSARGDRIILTRLFPRRIVDHVVKIALAELTSLDHKTMKFAHPQGARAQEPGEKKGEQSAEYLSVSFPTPPLSKESQYRDATTLVRLLNEFESLSAQNEKTILSAGQVDELDEDSRKQFIDTWWKSRFDLDSSYADWFRNLEQSVFAGFQLLLRGWPCNFRSPSDNKRGTEKRAHNSRSSKGLCGSSQSESEFLTSLENPVGRVMSWLHRLASTSLEGPRAKRKGATESVSSPIAVIKIEAPCEWLHVLPLLVLTLVQLAMSCRDGITLYDTDSQKVVWKACASEQRESAATEKLSKRVNKQLVHSHLPIQSLANVLTACLQPVVRVNTLNVLTHTMESATWRATALSFVEDVIQPLQKDVADTITWAPIIAFTSSDLAKVPLEFLPTLRNQPYCRGTSLDVFFRNLAYCRDTDTGQKIKSVDLRQDSVFFVVNPERDIPTAEKAVSAKMRDRENWAGVCGCRPLDLERQIQESLSTKDLYLYCGHNGGEQYITGDAIQRSFTSRGQSAKRASAVLIGCSSGRLTAYGCDYEVHGPPYDYILAGRWVGVSVCLDNP